MGNIYVTKSFLPPLDEYQAYLRQIWDSGLLTNQGPLLQKFEEQAKSYLGVDSFHFVNNGTVALQLALRALDITEGEVITTPFSFVATTSSILWERCKPVFVDIEPETFCIDPTKIEAAITEQTKAIMAVHVFGFPCDVEAIQAIAERHNIKVIYDAAHTFGATYKGKALLSYGDVATCSFHATKVFHTIEGGCVVAADPAVNEKLDLMKKFGAVGDTQHILGINAKSSEFQAAMGLCNFKYLDEIIQERQKVSKLYDKLLDPVILRPKPQSDLRQNYIYYPILLKDESRLLQVLSKLNSQNIFPRRYFYPSLNTLPYLETKQSCPVSENISSRVLCLPLYVGLSEEIVKTIAATINEVSKQT